jgi:bifunctional NMN adenylyltransferase/nudix hydrolase
MSQQKISSSLKKKRYDFLVFIGRFQPFHLGHQSVVRTALQQADRVIILVGSSRQPRSLRNPWTFAERKQFVKASFTEDDSQRISIAPLLDAYNDLNWVRLVQQTVEGIVCQYPITLGKNPHIGLIGHDKDHSSYYLSLFPQWKGVNVNSYQGLAATPMRDFYFAEAKVPEGLPATTATVLAENLVSDMYQHLSSEYRFTQGYKKSWETAPYPPTFVTVDAVVVQSGHILLVERKARPGKGLLALPGGFVDQNETLKNAVIRELREETRIKVPAPVLLGSISKQEVFDNPNRSLRGRTITHAYLFALKDDPRGLPKVKGGDDAKHAFWLPLSKIDPETLFEDHFHIIEAMIG